MKSKKLFSLILSLLILAAPLVSCTASDDTDNPHTAPGEETVVTGETVGKTQLLTHIFRGTQISLPEEYSLNSNILPIYNTETGEITCYCTYFHEVLDEEGNYVDYLQEMHILTLASDGTVVDDTKLEIEGEENGYINSGAFVGDSFIYLTNTYDPDTGNESFYAAKYNLTDGTHVKSDSLQPLFSETDQSRPWFYINYMAVDKEGYIYLSADQEVLVLDPDFIKSFSIFSENWIDSLTASPDGTVYVSGYFADGRGLCPIDKTTKSLGAPVEYEGSSSLRNVYFGEGYDMYFTDDNGLYGLTLADGSYEMVMSYQNSDTTEDSLEIMKVLNPTTFIASERDPVTYENYLAIYEKADDIDLSTINVIELASADGMDYQVPAMIVDFNKNNPGTRIVVNDYSVYNTDENWQGGMTKLTTDIVNGLYKPDIVFGSINSELMRQIVSHGLYTDLYTFIDSDDRVKRDDLFGAVKNLFGTEDGKMWGIGNEFEIQSIIAPTALIGDRDSWTFTEMLDFAESLPAGVELMEDLTQLSAQNYLLGTTGYAAFIDEETNTASFDSPEFVRYLNFIKTLPAEIDYASRPDDYYDTRYQRYHNGEIALKNAYVYSPGEWVGLETAFNTKDYTLIGYPVKNAGEAGSVASCYSAYVITSFTEFPEEAWSFIKSIAAPEFDENRGRLMGIHSFPILKSLYDVIVEDYYTYEYEFYFDGSAGWGTYDPEHPSTEELDRPGIRTYFTKEDGAKLKEFLDTKVTAPTLTEAVNEEILAIINEEISSFSAGMRDAQGCADIIQSRVSIWLAEHE